MKILQITLQHQRDNRWPVSATLDSSDGLPYRQEGELALGEEWAEKFRALALDPEQYGEELGRALFREGILIISKQAESSIQPQPTDGDDVKEPEVVHLFLNVEAPELQPLRWERLAFPDDDGTWISLAQHQRLVFSYYFPSLVSRQYPALNKHGLKALLFIASPLEESKGYKPFDVPAAVARLEKGFGNIPVKVMSAPQEATWKALRDELNQRHYPILHIVAHGYYKEGQEASENKAKEDPESYLILLNEQQKPQTVSATTLIEQLKRMNGQLPSLIFLSSCETATPEASQGAHGHLARRLLNSLGTPATIAMSDKVQIETAYLLGENFYTYLHRNAHVDIALATAGMALINRNDRHLPVLYHRLGSRPLFTQEDKLLEQLDAEEIKHGLDLLDGNVCMSGLLDERAPVLREEFESLADKLDGQHPALKDLNELDALCREATDIGFAALAQGEPVGSYNAICPFPGMRPFKQSENGKGTDYRQFFFGRDDKVVELCQRLEQLDVLLIKGASGSGKSSIVYAGVLPALQKRYEEKQQTLQTVTLRPRCIKQVDHALVTPDETLRNSIKDLNAAQDAIIFVDQFEELFTTCQFNDPHQQKQVHQQFLDALLGLPKQHLRWKVILTMRADFTGDCAAYENLRQIVQNQSELLPAMNMDELRTAIEKQAGSVGLTLEQGLLHTILDEVEGQPGAMPLLQYLLWLLWKRRRGRYLRMEEYEKIQQVGNAIADIAESHYRQYDANPLTQSYLRNIYLRLTRPDTDRQKQAGAEKYRDTRQRINQSELYPEGADPKLIRQLIQELADGERRLVVTHEDEVEIAHETLIQHWPRLNSWLNDSSLNIIRQSIAESTRAWKAETNRHRANSLLTHTGTRLQDIEQYKQQSLLFSNPQEEEYLQACYAKDRREARNQRYVRVFAVAMLLLFLVAGLVSWLAIGQKNRADDRLAEQHFQKGIELRDSQSQEWGKAEDYFAKALDVVADKRLRANIQFAYADLQRFDHRPIGRPMQHQGGVDGVTVFAGDSRVLTWSNDGTARVWDASSGEPVGKPMQHRDYVNGASVFAEDTRVLTWSDDGTVRVWDTRSGKPVSQPMQHQDRVIGASVFAEDSRVLTWSSDHTARVWDASSGEPVGKPIQHQDSVIGATVFAGDSRVLTWSNDARVWDTRSGEPVGKPMQHQKSVIGATVFAGDTRVLTWSYDGTARVWDTRSGEPISQPMQHQDSVSGAIVFAGDSRVLTWSNDGTARVWDARSGEPVSQPMQHQDQVNGATVFAGDTRVLTWSNDGTARVWDTRSGESVSQPMQHQDPVNGAAVFAGGLRVLTWSAGNGSRVWDVRSGEPVSQPMQHQDQVNGATVFAGDSRVLTWSNDGTARVWDARSGELVSQPMQHQDPVIGATLFAGDSRVLTWSDDGTARVWDARSSEPVSQPMLHQDPVIGATVFAGDLRVLTWSDDGTARVWDARSSEPVSQPMSVIGATVFTEDSHRLIWSADGTAMVQYANSGDPFGKPMSVIGATVFAGDSRVLTWSIYGTARVWDANSGEPVSQPMQHQRSVIGATVFAGDSRVLTWSDDGTARVWDANSGEPVGQPMQHQKSVNGAAVFAGDSRVLTWSDDGTARVWDARSGEPVSQPMQHQGDVWGASVLAGETRVLTWGRDARVWDARSGEPVGKPIGEVGGVSVLAGEMQVLTWGGNSAQVRDARSGEPVGKPMQHQRSVNGATVFARDSRVLTWSDDGTARVWDTRSGEPVSQSMQHQDPVIGTTVFADGAQVLTCSNDGTARVWDARSGELVSQIQHREDVNRATVFAGDSRVLIWSADGTARVWDARSGEPVGKPMRHQESVTGAIVFAGDSRVLTWSADGTARVWILPSTENTTTFLHEIKHSIQSGDYINSVGDLKLLTKEQLVNCQSKYDEFEKCETSNSLTCALKRQWWSLQKFLGKLPTIEDCLTPEASSP